MKGKMILLALASVFFLGFYGVSESGDGAGDMTCGALPTKISGPFLVGSFTVGYDQSAYSFTETILAGHYNAHVVLTRFNQTHLFAFAPGVVVNKSLCEFTNEQLKTSFAKYPCRLEVGEAFGLSGYPVIVDLHILKRDFCNSLIDIPILGISSEAMIAGEIVIRVVPTAPGP